MSSNGRVTTTLTAGELRVEFVWSRDRFAHTVSVEAAGVWHELLRSFEGEPENDWPESPPLQQIHVEERAETAVALLVGMAGRSHWSMSTEVVRDKQQLVFDVACRCASGAMLRSTYEVMRPMVSSDQRCCRWKLDEGSATVGYELRLSQANSANIVLAAMPTGICILPAGDHAAEMRTVSWRYEFVRLGR